MGHLVATRNAQEEGRSPCRTGACLYYPKIDDAWLTPLRHVIEEMKTNPDYLSGDCPYSTEVKALLSRLVGVATSPHQVDEATLLEELQELYQEVKCFGDMLNVQDVAERMSYFRTRTSLIEKIYNLIEKTVGMAQVSMFQEVVLGIFEDMLTPEQRGEALERLKKVG